MVKRKIKVRKHLRENTQVKEHIREIETKKASSGSKLELNENKEPKFRIIFLDTFKKSAKKNLSQFELDRLKKKIPELEENGDKLGKPLGPYYLREIKFNDVGKRVYYLVFEHKLIILFVSSSNKKLQDDEIEEIRRDIWLYRKYVDENF